MIDAVRRGAASLVLVGTLGVSFLSGCSSVDLGAGAAAPTGTGTVAFGIAVPGSRPERLAQIESDIGHRFALVRVFRRWDDALPDTELQRLIDAGYRIHLSVRPRTEGGRDIAWRTLADIEPGDPDWDRYQRWLDLAARLPEGSYFTLNHEPETTESASNGGPTEFIAMWRRMAELLDQKETSTRLVWTMTGGSFSDGRAEQWYPGDDVVDVIGSDSYNWFTCQGTERPWRDLESLLTGPLAFAAAHDKPLALPEFASATDAADPGRRVEWMHNAAAWLSQPEVANQLEYVAWFDVTAPGGAYPDCIWDHDVDDASRQAFADMVGHVSPR